MRVTSSMMVRSTLRDLNQGLGRMQHTQSRLTSGNQMLAASDDPSGAARAMGLRQQLNRSTQQTRSLNDSKGWLGTADTALTSGLELMARAKEVAVRAASTGGTGDPAARQAMAAEMAAIRTDLLALANAKHGSRSVFGGTAAGPAYDATGAFVGNTTAVLRDVAPSTTLTVNVSGTQVFGTGGGPIGNVFEVLDRMAAAILVGDDTGMAVEHTNLDTAVQTMSAAVVEVGTRGARVEQIEARMASDKLNLVSRLSEVEDVDVTEALITVQAQENAYTAALQVAAKILPVSLLDYLR